MEAFQDSASKPSSSIFKLRLQQSARNALPFFVVFGTFGTVYLTLYFSHEQVTENLSYSTSITGLIHELASWVFVTLLHVGHQNPVVAVLQGVNLATALYAFFYYLLLRDLSGGLKVLILVVLLLINFVEFKLSQVSTTQGASDARSFGSSYVVSGLYLFLFAIVDGLLHWFAKPTNGRRAYYGFSCFYVQIPSLLTLLLAFKIQSLLHSYGVSQPEALSFLAGLSAAIMFLSNFVLALMDSGYCRKRLQITCPRE